MSHESNQQLLKKSWQIHDLAEQFYQQHEADKSHPEWLEKQRYLLVDMATHLIQTALQEGPLDQSRLTENLFSIMTIADGFLPGQELKQSAMRLLEQNQQCDQ
ncbi:hypothetical protein ACFODZ_04940 [Marinicella sediminis]|uniref:Uncharacterized protein n=1 Tax=Marinicella sediminis TaxID=1792834 RepID=A0ABV7JA61_9GAMM|nr:hypothetical protein [Marinicella sediminis]